eukprot:comp16790_c0_seq1/m.15175 comp16790_c0_seq1/g.15175  ORF comp16790_c0_seq1/g.15175 comp16790_c0_seq1/m.15175 type:complete len:269 (-) comp16790_c0_seq1:97-903(-)
MAAPIAPNMLHVLKGKVALITGSTSGIGLSTAKSLAQNGCHIILNGFGDWEKAQKEVLEARSDEGVRVEYVGADVGKVDEVEMLMKRVGELFGGVDILVNNAGFMHNAKTEEHPVERWDAVIAVNLSAAFHTTRLALPIMQKQNWGRIINISTVYGLVGSPGRSAFVAAKHGLIGFTKVVALENAKTGITCNSICPGWVATPPALVKLREYSEIHQCDFAGAVEGFGQPSGQIIQPEEISALVMFLCSDAGAQVRGVAWNMDGGVLAQ